MSDETAAPVHVAVLGPLVITAGGEERTLTPPRERALLCRLVLDSPEPVSPDQLIDELWGDSPPRSAPATLQTYVSHVRKVVAPARIDLGPTGYRLVEIATDLQLAEAMLERSLAAGSANDAASLAQHGIDLWRGEPLVDLADSEAAGRARPFWTERYLRLCERLAEAHLLMRRFDGALAVTERLVHEHPLREHLVALHMKTLYLAGRQADALAAGDQLRRLLADELGLEPSPFIRALELQILNHDPELSAIEGTFVGLTSDEQLPLPLPPRLMISQRDVAMVGRTAEVRHLIDLLREAERGASVPPMFIRGDAGIGKTRLAREFAAVAAADGDAVLWGHCPPEHGGAFHAIAEALDHLWRHRPNLFDGLSEALAPVLSGLTRADPMAALHSAAWQRWSLFEAVGTVIERAVGVGAVVLVVDDVQWADQGTIGVIEHLAMRQIAGLFVLATMRAPEPTEAPGVSDAVARMARLGGVEELLLGGLSADEAATLLTRMGTHPAPNQVENVVEHSNGNPFFIREMAAELGTSGADRPDQQGVLLTAGISALLNQRLRHFSTEEIHVLTAAAAIGGDFDLRAVSEVADVSEQDALVVAEHAIALGLVNEADEVHRFAFHHALVRATVRANASASRLAVLDERADRARIDQLARSSHAMRDRITAELIAVRREPTGDDVRIDESRALLGRLAGTSTTGRRSKNPLDEYPLTNTRAGRVMMRLAESNIASGAVLVARRQLIEVSQLAVRLDDAVLAAESAVAVADLVGVRVAAPTRSWDAEVNDAIEAALRLAPDHTPGDAGVARANLLLRSAVAHLSGGADVTRAALLAAAASKVADLAEYPELFAETQLVTRTTRASALSSGDRLGYSQAACETAPRGSVTYCLALAVHTADLFASGRVADAEREIDRLRSLANEGVAIAGAWALLHQASLDLAHGRLAEAAAAIERVAAASTGVGERAPDDPLAILLFLLARAEGVVVDAAPTINALATRWPHSLWWRAASVIASEDRDACSQRLDEIQREFADGFGRDDTWFAGVHLVHEAAMAHGHDVALTTGPVLARHEGDRVVAGLVGGVAPMSAPQ